MLVSIFRSLRAAGCAALFAMSAITFSPSLAVSEDMDYPMRWWNTLTPDEMVNSLFGEDATEEQQVAAKKLYEGLDEETKVLVNEAAASIGGGMSHENVGTWWETLDCALMRVAAGDGNMADPSSPFCGHYPGSGHEKILSDEALAKVHEVGAALLGN